jgi:hypothetical protein
LRRLSMLAEVHAYVCYWLYIFCTDASSGGSSAKRWSA